MSLTPQQSALFQLAKRLCEQRGMLLLDLFDALYDKLPDIAPAGYRLSQCGCCGRQSLVPSGKVLREIRGDFFTQRQVAERVGVKQQHIAAMEKDNRNPTEPVVGAYQALLVEAKRQAAVAVEIE